MHCIRLAGQCLDLQLISRLCSGIFRRARYSTQPMTDVDSGQAATALAQMRAELAGLDS